MGKPLFKSQAMGFALDKVHILTIVLAVLVVALPIYLGWTGAFSWKAFATVLPGAVLSVFALVQKSPRDLLQQLLTGLPGGALATPPVAPPVDPTSKGDVS